MEEGSQVCLADGQLQAESSLPTDTDRLLELVTVKYADRPNFLAIAVRALAFEMLNDNRCPEH